MDFVCLNILFVNNVTPSKLSSDLAKLFLLLLLLLLYYWYDVK